MSENITLNTVGSLQDTTTAATTINNNFSTIRTAFQDVLSLSGVAPNQMMNSLDMNSNQIINLPSPATANSPLRLQDAYVLNGGGTISSLPQGGTTGQLLQKTSNSNFATGWTSANLRLLNPGNLYVSSTGSDTNPGTVSLPFLTIQEAVNTAMTVYDSQGSNIIINVGAGTFAGAQQNGALVGGGTLVIKGAGSSSTTVNSTLAFNNGALAAIGSMKITVSSGSNVLVENGSSVFLYDGGINFGSASTALVDVFLNSYFSGVNALGFTISGGATYGFLVSTNSVVILSANATYTLTGTPAFTTFVDCIDNSNFNPGINSVWVGSATGQTYALSINSTIDMEQSPNPLPGSTAGSLAYGSSYYGSTFNNVIGVGPYSLTLTASGQITPQTSGVATWNLGNITSLGLGQIPGTTTNDNASAGNIGEYISSVITSGSAISLTSATAANITSISLTAGDWDVDLIGYYLPAATTSITALATGLSTTSATLDTTPGRVTQRSFTAYVPGSVTQSSEVPRYRLSLSSTTTVYLVGFLNFTVSTASAYGIIAARRVR